MKFEKVLPKLRQGKRIARKLWEGKLCLRLLPESDPEYHIRFILHTTIVFEDLKTHRRVPIGSCFYEQDMLAEDWEIVE